MNTPLVSIGMPLYNGASFLRQSIDSILTQDFEDLELIICDNASTDETADICREYAARDSRVHYSRNETNIGAAPNFNKTFELARGKYFKWAAYDDECYPGMVRRCVEMLEKAPDSVTMVYPLAASIDEEGKTIRAPLDRIESKDPRPHRRLARLMVSLSMLDPIFGVFRSSYLKQTRLIGSFVASDYVLLAELAMLGQIWEIDEILFGLRAHPLRSVQANPNRRLRAAWHDPALARKLFFMPEWERMIFEILRSVQRSPLSPSEKARCSVMVPAAFYFQRFRDKGGLLKRKVKALPAVVSSLLVDW
jgi:glycosyltransferase involved in cell wall biosynthesis